LLGVGLRLEVHAIVGVLAVVSLGAATFSTFSLIAACIVKSRERFMGIGQVLTMPLFFASNAIYPLSMMPVWLRSLSSVNPLTYQVDALRYLMVKEGRLEFGLTFDFGIQLLILTLLIAIAAKLYPNIVR
jgi:ABC-2 type transport system permease protein